MVIGSVPLEFEIEREAIANNVGIERCLPFLIEEAQRLELSGVDFIVMPCNSLHLFIEEIRNSVSIPVLSIVEQTIEYLERNSITHLGLISTSATILNKVYESKLTEKGIDYIKPNEEQSYRINTIIQRLIDGDHRADDQAYLVHVAEELHAQGASHIALACTDLQLLNPISDKVAIFDTMKILADGTVDYILS